ISCTAKTACPTTWSCNALIGRCLADDHPDHAAPTFSNESVSPAVASAGDTITIVFHVDETLDRAPAVSFGAAPVTACAQDGSSFTCTYVVPAGQASDEGSFGATVDAIDLFANESSDTFGAVQLVFVVPAAPLLAKLSLVETAPSPEDPALVDGATNTFTLAGLAGAGGTATSVSVYSDAALAHPIGDPAPVSDGAFDAIALPAGVSGTVYVAGSNKAGRSSGVEVSVPVFSEISGGAHGLAPFTVTFHEAATLVGNPVVTVGGTAAVFASKDAGVFTYDVQLAGTEPQGVDAAVVRVTGVPSGLDASSRGTDASTITLDFVAPSVDVGHVVVTHAQVSGSAGAIGDAIGPVIVAVDDAATSALIGTATVLDDGSFASVDISAGAAAAIIVTATDAAGNITSSSSIAVPP
ncbi:MAG TPA: hypothetical protein VGO62_14550, partial [Myxococcota bacterium]